MTTPSEYDDVDWDDDDPNEPPPGPGISLAQMDELRKEFSASLDEYMVEWEESLREKVMENVDQDDTSTKG